MAARQPVSCSGTLLNPLRSVSLWLLLVIAAVHQVLMGGTFVFARRVLVLTDPFAVAFMRYTLAGAILCAVACRARKRPGTTPIAPADRMKIIILGLVIILINQTFYLYGQKLTTAAHGALLFTLTPIFAYLMAMIRRSESWSYVKGTGIILAVVGSGVIILGKGLRLDPETLKGDLIILVAVVAWAYYLVWGKPLVEKYGALRITAYTLGSGAVAFFPFGLYRLATADLSRIDSLGWVSVLYIAIISSVIGYFIWYWLLKYMEASRVAVLSNAQPIVAGILGIYLLGESLTLPFVLGGIIILAGVTITQKA